MFTTKYNNDNYDDPDTDIIEQIRSLLEICKIKTRMMNSLPSYILTKAALVFKSLFHGLLNNDEFAWQLFFITPRVLFWDAKVYCSRGGSKRRDWFKRKIETKIDNYKKKSYVFLWNKMLNTHRI